MKEQTDHGVKSAGWTLVATGILSALLMSQHPEGSGAGVMTPLVHGGLQATIIVQMGALILVARNFRFSLTVVIGLLFLLFGQMAGIGAATINGFIAPSLSSYPAGEIGPDIGRFAWEANQALARLGVIAMGVGFALWSVILWKMSIRWLAVAGWIIGLIPALLIAVRHIEMDLHGALFTYLAHAVWIIALGWTLARRK